VVNGKWRKLISCKDRDSDGTSSYGYIYLCIKHVRTAVWCSNNNP